MSGEDKEEGEEEEEEAVRRRCAPLHPSRGRAALARMPEQCCEDVGADRGLPVHP